MRKVIIIISTVLLLVIGGFFGRGFLPSDQLKQAMFIQLLQSYGVVQVHIDTALKAYEDNDLEVFKDQLARASAEARVVNRLIMGEATGELLDINIPNSIVSTNNTIANFLSSVVKDNISTNDVEVLYDLSEKFDLLFHSIDVNELLKEHHTSSRIKETIIKSFSDAGFGIYNPSTPNKVE